MGRISFKMFLQRLTIVAIFAIIGAQAEQNWYSLKTTWGETPFNGFYDQPRTIEEANNAGWVLVSNDCSEGASIFGASKWYRDAGNAFVTTAYFIDPMRICNGGRTQEEFDVEGTGNRLLFQNGPTANDVMVIPLTLDSIDADTTWFRHYCFLNMGRHYFQLNYDVNAPCDDLTPIQLIYSGGVLNGFVWQHPAALEGDRWETVTDFALSQIVDRPPQCLYDLVANPGVKTMHTYVRNYGTLCIDDRNQ